MFCTGDNMKKLFAAIMIAVVALLSFSGCGNVDNAADKAGELVTDASESMSEAMSEMMDNTDGDITDNTDDSEENGNID